MKIHGVNCIKHYFWITVPQNNLFIRELVTAVQLD